MTFTQAIEAGFKNYTNFSGRAVRSEYWFWFLFEVLVQLGLWIVDSVTGIGVLGILFTLGTLLPGIAVTVRRLHDIDKSGWFLLVGLIPIVGAIIMLVWMCQEGTPGPNRFGPVPVVSA
ncbi:MAG TPA: DUF805 domain-containing protein [Candidatus Limnocylindrales bacterium]|nr:DUF805 domain-containing protein [Candidatus Limnocylindrales bacterium]